MLIFIAYSHVNWTGSYIISIGNGDSPPCGIKPERTCSDPAPSGSNSSCEIFSLEYKPFGNPNLSPNFFLTLEAKLGRKTNQKRQKKKTEQIGKRVLYANKHECK